MPLILAFYCIVGGSEPLPDFRQDLYTRVLKHIITARWRGSDDTPLPDAGTCLPIAAGLGMGGGNQPPCFRDRYVGGRLPYRTRPGR